MPSHRFAAYPFSAVVGMADLKLALLLNAVSPAVGGVLVRGEKGTAKSTVVRALAALLPDLPVVEGCRFSCDPAAPDPECPDGPHAAPAAAVRPARLVELPVGASEDRLTGSLDLERALTEGVRAYEPGLLAAAHRGVLYVDEVNLLHDHLVDLLLDAAAMGRAFVEREGVSVRHAARFLLVGTMNPEEGELRPQLLDRFGLTVEAAATRDPAERADVVRRRLAYEADPEGFALSYLEQETALSARITAARALLPEVVLGDAALGAITAICAGFDVDGLRADLVTARTALALAAWHGRLDVTEEDVRQAVRLALPHRRRRDPFDAPGLDEQRLDELLEENSFTPDDDPGPSGGGAPPQADGGESDGQDSQESDGRGPEGQAPQDAEGQGGRGEGAPTPVPQQSSAGRPFRPRLFTVDGVGEGAPGRRSKARGTTGRVTGAATGTQGPVHLTATLRAAAPHQKARGRSGPGLVVSGQDVRRAVREGREGNLVLFVVDASGSMAARKRMSEVKTAVLSLLLDAYQRRDKVGLVTFRGTGAELALPPTSSVEAGARRLERMPTGGRTPLAAGLHRAARVLRTEALRDPSRRPLVVVVTDGRATHGPVVGSPAKPGSSRADHRGPDLLTVASAFAGVRTVVVDCESGPVRLGLASDLAMALGAELVPLAGLGSLAGVVREMRAA
ncbi:putative cobaltochelatase [Actinocorallia herbida]|uniref:putative cobaltochelatase n=1 Tax=Actinocorallia herbida TaxID=58109 RepID=UPI0024821702|nr:putative cobaltochelatase [Actinocorallia herbida]